MKLLVEYPGMSDHWIVKGMPPLSTYPPALQQIQFADLIYGMSAVPLI